jgi:curved DNA-binding protein CbpA
LAFLDDLGILYPVMSDYYEVLELDKSAEADQIKSNYRRLAMKWHPDRNAGSAEAEERFKAIGEAYATLSDPEKRRQYDEYLAGGGSEREEAARRAWEREAAGASQAGQGFGGYGFGPGFGRSWGFSGFTAEQASDMFMNEMYALAIELTMQNVGWKDIAAELEKRGCPADVAADIARKIEKRRKAVIRGTARPYFVRSAVSGFVGFCLFGLFGGVGLGLLGFLGLIMCLSGGYNLVRALYFIATGNAPRRSLI